MTETTEGKRVVYAVTSYDRGGNSGHVIEAIFGNRADAERMVAQDTNAGRDDWTAGLFGIEEYDLYESWVPELDPYTYLVLVGHVYPDATVERFRREEQTEGPEQFHAAEAGEPFNGHAQGHCGFHVYASGRDYEATERAFEERYIRSDSVRDGRMPVL